KMSTQRSQNGDRVADKKSEDILARCGVDFAASNTFILLGLMWLARSFGRSRLIQQRNSAVLKKTASRLTRRWVARFRVTRPSAMSGSGGRVAVRGGAYGNVPKG